MLRLIGKVLREHPGHEVRVSSTVGHVRGSAPHAYAGPRVRHQFEQTLENLFLDQLAVYTLDSWDFGPGDRYLDPVVEQVKALRELGGIRAVGLRGPRFGASALAVQRFLHLFQAIRPDVVSTQASGLEPLVDLGDGVDLAAFTARMGVGLMIASPMAHGALVGGPPERALAAWGVAPDRVNPARSAINDGLKELERLLGPAPDGLARAAMQFVLQQVPHSVVVPGVSDQRHVEQYINCLGQPLSGEDLDALRHVFATMLAGMGRPESYVPSQGIKA
jgi:aryl-alcohol dehydrogenase-like predicted oxidoreductase